MNEQLKQLAIESKLIAPEYNGFDHTRLSISQQKFAELIVRECASIANSGIDPAESHLIGNDILEHFGVEE